MKTKTLPKTDGQSLKQNQESRSALFLKSKIKFLDFSGIGRKYWIVSVDRIEKSFKKDFDKYMQNLDLNIQNGLGLVICGNVGTGKTSILSYIMQEIFKLGRFQGYESNGGIIPIRWHCKYDIRFCYVSVFFQKIVEFDWDFIKELTEADVLILDDWGVELGGDRSFSRFESLIETRYGNQKPTFITANMTEQQLIDLYKSGKYVRILDRFSDSEHYQILQIGGESQRK